MLVAGDVAKNQSGISLTMEYLFEKYNFPKRVKPAVTPIASIESIIQFRIPEDYISYAINYSGYEAFTGPEYVRLWDMDELIEINNAYNIFRHLPHTLGIGTNAGGDFIAFENLNGIIRVVLSPFIDLDPQYHTEIGNSFTDFLQRMDNGKEWFN
jgi:hypothetical protein